MHCCLPGFAASTDALRRRHAAEFVWIRGLGVEGLDRKLDMEGVNMPELAKALELGLFRPVIDRTGRTGTFDVHMRWALDSSGGFASAPNEPVPAPGATNLEGPSIFTAIQEQLGLKLESAKGPADVLVIDHVEKPTEN